MNDDVRRGGEILQRRRAREMALQLLFQREFSLDSPAGKDGDDSGLPASLAREMVDHFVHAFKVPSEVTQYGSILFFGVLEHLEAIDASMQAHCAHWKVSRMGLVDRSVMRIAIFEMKYLSPQLPPAVVINEAVDIAKKFGSSDSGSFVNGILDALARSL